MGGQPSACGFVGCANDAVSELIDVETARNAGMHGAMVMTGYGRSHSTQLEFSPDVLAEDLLSAVRAMLQ